MDILVLEKAVNAMKVIVSLSIMLNIVLGFMTLCRLITCKKLDIS